MKIKIAKFILASAFLFSFAYANKDKMPYPVELKTIDFIISSGIDIDFDAEKNEEKCSISYISGESKSDEADKNKSKNIFNIKSDTIVRTMDKIQSITNKSLSGSHLEYVLIGEKTASDSLEYFTKNYSKSPKIRLDVAVFITKDMTSEDFFKKAITSDIDINERLNGIVSNREQLSYLTRKNLKDILQIFYSEEKTGLIPVLEIMKSPDSTSGEDNGEDNKDSEDNKGNEEENKSNKDSENSNKDKSDEKEQEEYTFGYYGLGVIKNGGLVGYLSKDLVRPYLIATKGVKNTTLEIEDDSNDNNFAVFKIDNSQNKISFKFDGNNLQKIIFDINIETSCEEATSKKIMADSESLNNLNDKQTEIIKAEIENIIAKTKEFDTDFLSIGETLSIQHPYKWQTIKDKWGSIFGNLEYEINISTKIKRHYNIAS